MFNQGGRGNASTIPLGVLRKVKGTVIKMKKTGK
jgi:hypothetical protein